MKKYFFRASLVLSLLLLPTAFAADEDLLDLPPLPGDGDELELPPLPGEEVKPPAPKPPPPPPLSAPGDLLDLPPMPAEPAVEAKPEAGPLDGLDLPPLPAEESKPAERPVEKEADPLDGLDLPTLPGEESKVPEIPAAKVEDPLSGLDLPMLPGEKLAVEAPSIKIAEEKKEEPPAVLVPEPPSPEFEDMPLLPEAPLAESEPKPKTIEISRKVVKAQEPEAMNDEESPVELEPVLVQASRKNLPLPGMDFWNAGLLGSMAPTGGGSILIYGLLAFVLPWKGWEKIVEKLRTLFKKKA